MADETSQDPTPDPGPTRDRREGREPAGEGPASRDDGDRPAAGADPSDAPGGADFAATPNRDRRHEPPIIEGDVAWSEEQRERPAPDEPRESERPAASEPPQDSRAFGRAPLALSAAVGAAVGAVVATAAWWILEARSSADPDIVARLESLERAPRPDLQAALAALDRRVVALEGNIAGAPGKTVIEAHGQRIAALESTALSAKVATMDAIRSVAAIAQSARDDAAKALSLASATARGANGAAGAEPPAAADAALEERLGKVETDLAALAHRPVDLGPVAQRLEALEAALGAPKTETRVPADTQAPGGDGAGLAVVAQALIDRLRVGAPFPIEEAALERLGADPAKLAILKPMAERGAPAAGAMASDFAKVAPAALAAAAPEPSGGVVDRLLANMSKVVRVTPVGEVGGDDPAALVSQIGAALGRGQVQPAVAAWARLPEPSRRASQEWANEAQSRLAADNAAQALLDDGMARLTAARK